MYFVGTVRVTLVQTPLGSGGKAIVSQPSSISTVSGTTQQVYKPVTITTQQPGQTTLGIGSAGGIRTGINTTTLVPTPLSVGMLDSFLYKYLTLNIYRIDLILLMTYIYFYTILGLSSSSAVSATINTQPVRIGPIAGGTRTFSSSGAGGSQPLTVRYENELDLPKFDVKFVYI